ncbi:MAG: phosphatase PAP2 family protein [Gemmatimonadales bacterium]
MNGWWMTLTHADERLLRTLVLRRRPMADRVMRLVTKVGDVMIVMPLTLAVALGGVAGLQATGAVALWTLASSHLLVQVMKRSVCRERPTLPIGLTFLIEPEDRFSFPSGHAAAGLSVALPLATALGGIGGALVLLLGLAVGVSRCYLGVHYPGDVLVGWLLASSMFLAAPLGMP